MRSGIARTARTSLASILGFVLAGDALAQTPAWPLFPPTPLPPLPARTLPSSTGESAPVEAESAGMTRGAPLKPADWAAQAPRTASERRELLRSRSHEVWYGWQTLTLDASAVGVLMLGAAMKVDPQPFAISALALYGLGAPAVHVGHGALPKAVASLALRGALSLSGFALGYLSSHPRERGSLATQDGYLVALATSSGAIALDAAFLAWERWHVEPGAQVALSLGHSF